jgi:erythromycin esterase-like protein
MTRNDGNLIESILSRAIALDGGPGDFDYLQRNIGPARLVLIGEASHGTHEFYRIRAELTKRLIRDAGFNAVAVEADWPDAYRVNRFVKGTSDDADASEALGDFRRFPQWMWRNADVLDFVGWLRSYNDSLPDTSARVGFYGLDLYSMHASMRAVLNFLAAVDEKAAQRARERYSCFDHFGDDPQSYGYAVELGLSRSCEDDAVQQLIDMHRSAAQYTQRDGRLAYDDTFFAEQNALLVRNAERYYRSMFDNRISSWNIRDRHMEEMLGNLLRYLDSKHRSQSRVVVWAHNSHLGDARATEMGASGEVNLGQLVRERWSAQSFHLGFTTYSGTVTAAKEWGDEAERMTVRPALGDSYENLFHRVGVQRFLLMLNNESEAVEGLMFSRLERAIGVIYRPRSERLSHYFHASLPQQFDAVIHMDRTRAVEPMERTAVWDKSDLPETYPSAL